MGCWKPSVLSEYLQIKHNFGWFTHHWYPPIYIYQRKFSGKLPIYELLGSLTGIVVLAVVVVAVVVAAVVVVAVVVLEVVVLVVVVLVVVVVVLVV